MAMIMVHIWSNSLGALGKQICKILPFLTFARALIGRCLNRPTTMPAVFRNSLMELISGRTVGECAELATDSLIQALHGVPPDKLHSPALAITALRDALKCDKPP
jgi:hypothetical protein